MPKDKISLHQLMTLLFAALLSSSAILPEMTAARGGHGAWLSSLVALPVVLLFCRLVYAFFRGVPEDAGLAEALQDTFHRGGRAVTLICFIWNVVLLSSSARLYTIRLRSSGYSKSALFFLLLLLLGLMAWVGRGKLSAFARAGEIYFLILGIVLVLAVGITLQDVKGSYVFLLTREEMLAGAAASYIVLSALSYGVSSLFLAGHVTRRETNRRRSMQWLAALCGVVTLIQIMVLGLFGPSITAQMNNAFFQMMAGVGKRGDFHRLEAVVSAVWVLADFCRLGLLAFSGRAMLQALYQPKKEEAVIPCMCLAALLLALWALHEEQAAVFFILEVAPTGSIILTLALAAFMLLALRLRKKE